MSECGRIRSRREAFLDGELSAREAEGVRAHLAACEACRAELERGRAFLAAVTEAGRETAPPELRRRVEAILESGGGAAAPRGPGRLSWGLLAAAAVVALLLVARPWDGADRWGGSAPAAVAFAADHRAHAESAPSAVPIPPGEAPAAPLTAAQVRGLSRCVIEGRPYAHFTYRFEGATISAFVPLDGAPPPRSLASGGNGKPTTVVAVDAGGGRPAAVLVSDGLQEPALRSLWARG